MKKLLTLMMLLVAIVTGAWADDVTLFSTNFKEAGWTELNATDKAQTLTIGGKTVYVGANTTTNLPTVNTETGTLTWGNRNFSNKDCFLAIPVTGVNGAITITVANGEDKTRVTYAYIAGSSLGTISTTYNTDNAAPTVATIENLAGTDYVVYVGRQGSGLKNATSITITTPQASSDPSILASDASITATESGVEVTKDVAITGANLTGSTLTATLSPAVAGLSVSLDTDEISSGSISAVATLSYTATENASGTTTLTVSDGTTSKDITITYVAKVTLVELQTISEEKTWDFTKVSGSVQYSGDDKSAENVYANIPGLTFTAPFDENAIAFTGEYPIRDSKYAQNGSLHFKTSVAGKVKVYFQGTGGTPKDPARYVKVTDANGEQTGTVAEQGSTGTDEEFDVVAGDVIVGSTDAIRFQKIEFTPAPAPTTETITIPEDGVLTYVTENDLDFSTIDGDITAYAVTAVSATSATTAVVAQVPAGTALLIKGTAGSYDIEIAESASAITNLLLASDGTITGGDNIYAYSKTAKKFKKVASTVTIPAGKAYLQANAGDAIDIDFAGEATAVEAIAEAAEAVAPVKVVTAKGIQIGKYNIAGQQVK